MDKSTSTPSSQSSSTTYKKGDRVIFVSTTDKRMYGTIEDIKPAPAKRVVYVVLGENGKTYECGVGIRSKTVKKNYIDKRITRLKLKQDSISSPSSSDTNSNSPTS